MGVQLTKDSIDLGIVTTNTAAMVAFYRDVLGFADDGETPMPGGSMHRLRCGTSSIKIVSPGREPKATAAPGGIQGATGYRYWTISVSNLDDIVASCDGAGRNVFPPRVGVALLGEQRTSGGHEGGPGGGRPFRLRSSFPSR